MRSSVYASRGIVATSQPLAAEAGLFILREGGNAVDAALATAITLTVVEPTSNGLGSDAFALVSDGERLWGLNGSGALPAASSLPRAQQPWPETGWLPVMVPGAPRAWADLHERFGRLPFPKLFAPAVGYARDGFPLSPVVARFWRRAADRFAGPAFSAWQDTFLPAGFVPRAGAIWRSPALARTLERIAETRAEDFYEGSIAQAIDQAAEADSGPLRASDLAGHRSLWVDPLSISYHGCEVCELPPNSQGIVALEALGILSGRTPADPVEALHESIEAVKFAFADALERVGDPRDCPAIAALLDPGYLRERAAGIRPTARPFRPEEPFLGGTVFLAAADRSGLMVSFIQSNYMGFGSGIVVPGTGIALSNRALCFSRNDGHPNRAGGGRRSYHTLMPGFLMRGGRPWGPFGVMGGFMQPQGHLQLVQALIDQGSHPQEAVDRPRWRWDGGVRVLVEPDFSEEIRRALAQRGHEIVRAGSADGFGRAQLILRTADGGFVAGSDSRADGRAAGW
jgi:gamma-glutamyltranspeptidase/glutathione hydrolase